MIAKIVYECENCSARFDTEKECKEHESKHRELTFIKCQFLYGNPCVGIPDYVLMSDNKNGDIYRYGLIEKENK